MCGWWECRKNVKRASGALNNTRRRGDTRRIINWGLADFDTLISRTWVEPGSRFPFKKSPPWSPNVRQRCACGVGDVSLQPPVAERDPCPQQGGSPSAGACRGASPPAAYRGCDQSAAAGKAKVTSSGRRQLCLVSRSTRGKACWSWGADPFSMAHLELCPSSTCKWLRKAFYNN